MQQEVSIMESNISFQFRDSKHLPNNLLQLGSPQVWIRPSTDHLPQCIWVVRLLWVWALPLWV